MRHNGGMFAGVDLATDRGKADILSAIDQIISMAFAAEHKQVEEI